MELFEGLEADTSFYLVRHGESEGNKEKRIQGHTDLPLTPLGLHHAELTGKWFASHQIDWLASSPLARARQTAQGILDHGGPQLRIEAREELKELDTGVFSNRTFDEIKLNDPEIYHDFHAMSWAAVPGAESVSAIQARARLHWNYLIQVANTGKKHLVSVSHYGFIQWLYKTSFGQEHQSWMPLLTIGNCAVFHLSVSPRISAGKKFVYSEWRLINYPAWQYMERA